MTTTRRTFIGGIGAAAITSCTPAPRPQPAPQAHEMIEKLRSSGVRFVDSQGKEVNLAGLEKKLDGAPSTLSFLYASCGDICPLTAAALARVSEEYPPLQHVVISVDGLGDYPITLPAAMNGQGLRTDGVTRNTMILYPTSDGSATPQGLLDGSQQVGRIQHEFGLLTLGEDPRGHSGTVTLFDGSGTQLGQATSAAEITQKFPPLLAASRSNER